MLADVVMTLPRWPIVGRRPELEVFEGALGSGERAGLVIYGRAGVGEARLADERAARAVGDGWAPLFQQPRRSLRDRHRGRRLVIVADDVALLDVASLALLGYLAA